MWAVSLPHHIPLFFPLEPRIYTSARFSLRMLSLCVVGVRCCSLPQKRTSSATTSEAPHCPPPSFIIASSCYLSRLTTHHTEPKRKTRKTSFLSVESKAVLKANKVLSYSTHLCVAGLLTDLASFISFLCSFNKLISSISSLRPRLFVCWAQTSSAASIQFCEIRSSAVNECRRFSSSVRASNILNPLDAKAVSVFCIHRFLRFLSEHKKPHRQTNVRGEPVFSVMAGRLVLWKVRLNWESGGCETGAF